MNYLRSNTHNIRPLISRLKHFETFIYPYGYWAYLTADRQI